MKTKLLKIADFLRLIDETGNLSLTNIAVIVVICQLFVSKIVSFTDVAALLTVLSSYTFKRYIQRRNRYSKEPKIEIAQSLDHVKLDSMFNDLERLKLASGFKNVTVENSRKNF